MMARTSCYEGLLDLGTKDADELSSALFCDARVVDSPHEVDTILLSRSKYVLEVSLVVPVSHIFCYRN